jgi:hypothetical protein
MPLLCDGCWPHVLIFLIAVRVLPIQDFDFTYKKVRIHQKASPDLHMYLADFDDRYAARGCCFRECTMNLTSPAKTDPIMAT